MAGSTYAPSGVLTQRHSMMVRAGSGVGSAALGLSVSTLGDFIPDAFDHRFALNGSATTRRTLRHSYPAPRDSWPRMPRRLRVRCWRASRTTTRSPHRPDRLDVPPVRAPVHARRNGHGATSDRWTHAAVIGVDGYRLKRRVESFGTPFTSAADSALRAARGSAVRGTARVSSVAQLGMRGSCVRIGHARARAFCGARGESSAHDVRTRGAVQAATARPSAR